MNRRDLLKALLGIPLLGPIFAHAQTPPPRHNRPSFPVLLPLLRILHQEQSTVYMEISYEARDNLVYESVHERRMMHTVVLDNGKRGVLLADTNIPLIAKKLPARYVKVYGENDRLLGEFHI